MSASFKQMFNKILSLTARDVTIERIGRHAFPPKTIRMSKSLAFRQRKIVEDTYAEGTEWVVSKDILTLAGIDEPLATDRIVDPEFGLMMVSEVEPMTDIRGQLIGYRIKVN